MPKKIDWEAKKTAWERAVTELCDEVVLWRQPACDFRITSSSAVRGTTPSIP